MNKKLQIDLKPTPKKSPDDWVNERQEPLSEPQKEKTKRLTVDMPESLHRDFKLKAVGEGEDMAELIRGWIKQYVYSPVGSKKPLL